MLKPPSHVCLCQSGHFVSVAFPCWQTYPVFYSVTCIMRTYKIFFFWHIVYMCFIYIYIYIYTHTHTHTYTHIHTHTYICFSYFLCLKSTKITLTFVCVNKWNNGHYGHACVILGPVLLSLGAAKCQVLVLYGKHSTQLTAQLQIIIIIVLVIIIVIFKGAIWDFLQSPHCAVNRHLTRTLKWPGSNLVQIKCSTSSGFHVQLVLRVIWYERTAQLLSLTEFKSHLF